MADLIEVEADEILVSFRSLRSPGCPVRHEALSFDARLEPQSLEGTSVPTERHGEPKQRYPLTYPRWLSPDGRPTDGDASCSWALIAFSATLAALPRGPWSSTGRPSLSTKY